MKRARERVDDRRRQERHRRVEKLD
jgi:hypothetical protein